MTETVKRASNRTTLRIGEVEAPIGLFRIDGDARTRKWAHPPEESEEKEAARASPLGTTPGKKSSGKKTGGKRLSPSKADPPPPKPKGVMKDDGRFVDLTEHIRAVAERTTLDCLEVVSFISRQSVPRERIVGAYYVGAGSGEGYSPSRIIGLLFRAMKERGRAAVVRWGKRSRSSVGVMVPHRSGALVVLEMAYAEHLLEPNADCLAHQHLDIEESQVTQAIALIDAMADRRDSLDDIHDHRAELEEELVTRALHGELDDFEAAAPTVEEEATELGTLIQQSIATAQA